MWHRPLNTRQPVNPRLARGGRGHCAHQLHLGFRSPQPGPSCTPPAHPVGWHCPCSPDEDTKAPGEGRAEPHWPGHSVLCSDGGTAASPCPRPCPCAVRDLLSFSTVFRLPVRNTPCPCLAQACLEIKGGVHPPGLWGRAQGRGGYQSG